MQTLADIKHALAERGLAPRKSLGQNFLIDHNLTRKLVDASGVGEGDTVLEVGPGTGVLTDALLERGAHVVACELDRGLAQLLRDRLAGDPRFTLVEGDCLRSKRAISPDVARALADRPFTLVANLPYGAATPLMTVLLADHPACLGQFVTIQKEVADRFAAAPGTKAYGVISVLASLSARLERVATLPPECFWPRPDVTSAMLAIRPRDDAPPPEERRALIETCQVLFTSRRKQIGGVLKKLGHGPETLQSLGIDPTLRIDAMEPSDFLALSGAIR